MGYQILQVKFHLGDFIVHQGDDTPKPFTDFCDLLDFYSAQGLEYLDSLPLEWRHLKEADTPAGPMEIKGLHLSQFLVIFREWEADD